MAGSLIKIQEEIVTSAVASVELGGANWDSSYDVYMVKMNNVSVGTVNANVYLRVTESGTPNTTSNYDFAYKQLRADTTFSNVSSTNQAEWELSGSLEDEAGKTFNNITYIFNANNSSEFTFITTEQVYMADGGTMLGNQGGGVFTVTSSVDGVNIFLDSPTADIDSGTFTLYGLKK